MLKAAYVFECDGCDARQDVRLAYNGHGPIPVPTPPVGWRAFFPPVPVEGGHIFLLCEKHLFNIFAPPETIQNDA